MDNDKRTRTRRLLAARRSADRREAPNDSADPGRLATPEEASKAWVEVGRLLQTIGRWNQPKAAEYIRNNPPTAEAIALGLFARDILRRSDARRHGARGGRTGGFKGGRPSKKPTNVQLRKAYDIHLADCGSPRQAGANFVKQLQETYHVKASAARGWIRGASIRSGKKT